MNRARRKRISDLLMLSDQWRPGTVQIRNDGIVWAAPAEGSKSRRVVGPVGSIVDEDGNAQGEWALLEVSAAETKGYSAFELAVLERLKAIEDRAEAAAPMLERLSALFRKQRPVQVIMPEKLLKETVAKTSSEVRTAYSSIEGAISRNARLNVMTAALAGACIALGICSTAGAYIIGENKGELASHSEIAAANWANSPEGKAAHNILVRMSEPSKALLMWCNEHNWQSDVGSCFDEARRSDKNTINAGF